MPSSWNRINADWSNLLNTRLDPVLNELYKATQERDYWLCGLIGIDKVIDSNTKNSSYQLRYLYSTFNRWLKPSDDIPLDEVWDGSFFLDDNGGNSDYPSDIVNSRTLIQQNIFGMSSLDYSSDGTLSTLINFDLSFLESGHPPDGRVNLNHLECFYKILNLDIKSRMNRMKRTNEGFEFNSAENTSLSRIGFVSNDLGNTDRNATENEIIDLVEDYVNSREVRFSNFSPINFLSFGVNNINVDEGNYNGSIQGGVLFLRDYNFSDFEATSFIYNKYENDDGISFSYSPSDQSSRKENPFFNYTDVNAGDVLSGWFENYDFVLNSISYTEGDRVSADTFYSSLKFINLNNSSILKYYTESED